MGILLLLGVFGSPLFDGYVIGLVSILILGDVRGLFGARPGMS